MPCGGLRWLGMQVRISLRNQSRQSKWWNHFLTHEQVLNHYLMVVSDLDMSLSVQKWAIGNGRLRAKPCEASPNDPTIFGETIQLVTTLPEKRNPLTDLAMDSLWPHVTGRHLTCDSWSHEAKPNTKRPCFSGQNSSLTWNGSKPALKSLMFDPWAIRSTTGNRNLEPLKTTIAI